MTGSFSSETSLIEFDVIIVGAGINGAGVARDAAMRGLKVLLVDKGDLSAGTTGWSTRLIHGGLRYLEHGEFRLVRESLREREILLRIAPHLVKPLPMLIPIYANRRRGPWTIRAGMIAYDLLSFDKTLPRHRILSPTETLRQAQGLSVAGLLGSAIYYDAQVEYAERLVVENVVAAREHGAVVATYAQVTEFVIDGNKVRGVSFADQLTGEKREVCGRLVVNASGPWVDHLLARTGIASQRLIGGTKGSHIVVPPFPGAPLSALYVEAAQNQRPFFIIAWNGNYLIGTTDIRYEGNSEPVINEEETDYLLSETNRLIPAANLLRETILFTYSGVRPLAYSKQTDEQGITRRHFIHEHTELDGLISLIGGKLTTYRGLAEQTVDLCLRRLERKMTKCTTATTPLPGAGKVDFETFSDEVRKAGGVSVRTCERLLRIYGSRAAEVVQLVLDDTKLLEVFDPESGAIGAEVVFAFRCEMAQTLTDCLLRRTMVGLNSTSGLKAVEPAAQIGQRHLGWSQDRANREVERYRHYIEEFRPGFGQRM